MSKAVKSIASIALPVVGTIVAPGIGTALGSTLSGTTLGTIGGAIGGASGGAISGGGAKGALTGAALGGAGGYLSNGGLTDVIGTAGGPISSTVAGPTQQSGILGSLGSVGRIVEGAGNTITSSLGNSSKLLTLGNIVSNLYSASAGANAAKKAAAQQAAAISQARRDIQPYVDSGNQTVGGLTQLVNDPQAQADYIRSNPFYQTLADDTEQRLLANQAAKGKVGSGGTAAELQNQLLQLGNSLLNQNITQRQNLVNTGYNAANTSADLSTQAGNANAAGTIGAYNAQTGAINNALNTQVGIYGAQNNPLSNLYYSGVNI